MPIYKNDLPDSIIKLMVVNQTVNAPSVIVRFIDDSEQVLEGDMVALFIKKHTARGRGNTRNIGPELEKKLMRDFSFLFK